MTPTEQDHVRHKDVILAVDIMLISMLTSKKDWWHMVQRGMRLYSKN